MNLTLNLSSVGRNTSNKNNIFKSMIANGLARRTSWHYKLSKKGFIQNIRIGGIDYHSVYAQKIDLIITVLKEQFPGMWDFNFQWGEDFKHVDYNDEDYGKVLNPRIILRYKDFYIRNENDSEHNIKDLIVELPFSLETTHNWEFIDDEEVAVPKVKFYFAKPRGCTAHQSYEEWFNGYVHSHLNSNKPKRASHCFHTTEFCLGGESDVNYWRNKLIEDSNFNLDNLRAFFYSITSLVEYESLEGRPYMFIENLGVGEEVRPASLDNNNMDKYYSKIRERMTELNVDFVLSDNIYKIKHNSKFKSLIRDLVISSSQGDSSSDIRKNTLVIRHNEGYVGYSFPNIVDAEELNDALKNGNGEIPYTIIHGEKIECRIDAFSGEMPDINNYKMHPNFLNYVSTKLEQELYKQAVKRSAIAAGH